MSTFFYVELNIEIFGDYGFGMGVGWVFMILFWVVMVFIIIALMRKGGAGDKETAEEILKKRYAQGEISKEEFQRMKHDDIMA